MLCDMNQRPQPRHSLRYKMNRYTGLCPADTKTDQIHVAFGLNKIQFRTGRECWTIHIFC